MKIDEATNKKTVLGDRLPRLEDPPLIQGQGRYAGDINFPNQLHMRILRAPYAHAEIRNIDTETAKAVPPPLFSTRATKPPITASRINTAAL